MMMVKFDRALKIFERRAVNLKELAHILNLSQTTVSRALNGYPEVGEKTRLRVMEAARKHNYHPSSSAKRLAMGRSHTIGHVVQQDERHSMINPHFSDFIAGAGETYQKHGYDMLLSVVRPEDEDRFYRELARSGRVDGMVIHAPRKEDPRIELLKSLNLPFAVHGRTEEQEADHDWLDVNNRSSFKRATEFLIDLGHRRIGLLNGLEDMDFAYRRRLGFEATMHKHGLEVDPQLLYSQDMIEPYGYEATRNLLKLDKPPTALLSSSILPALGAVRALQQAGMRLGHDLSIVVFDDQLSFMQYSGVPLFTSMRSSIMDAGRRLAEILISNIDNPGRDPIQELWEADLVVGRSTGPCPVSP